MSDIINLIAEPWGHVFMTRAFVVAIAAGITCGVIGTFVVLRGIAFIGDAVAHAVFPGVAIAFVLRFNMMLGGAIAGVVTALSITSFSQNRRLREDTVIGVFFAFAFGLGIVIVSTQSNYTGDLASFLFGQILGISNADVIVAVVAGAILVALTVAIRKELVTVALDRETAKASGLPVVKLDGLLYVMVTLAIVISLQAVGNILVLALLITPAATARLLTDRLSTMMLLAAGIGGGSSLLGLYITYRYNLASGGLIVLILTTVFLVVWFLAPRHGLIARKRTNIYQTGLET
ncbi:MAG: anchored repeat-type ABC transporter permease subunit [Acidimicrobiia bacterium]